MTFVIIDLLEIIYVDHKDGYFASFLIRSGEKFGKKFGKQLASENHGDDDAINKELTVIEKGDEEDNIKKIVLPVESIDYIQISRYYNYIYDHNNNINNYPDRYFLQCIRTYQYY